MPRRAQRRSSSSPDSRSSSVEARRSKPTIRPRKSVVRSSNNKSADKTHAKPADALLIGDTNHEDLAMQHAATGDMEAAAHHFKQAQTESSNPSRSKPPKPAAALLEPAHSSEPAQTSRRRSKKNKKKAPDDQNHATKSDPAATESTATKEASSSSAESHTSTHKSGTGVSDAVQRAWSVASAARSGVNVTGSVTVGTSQALAGAGLNASQSSNGVAEGVRAAGVSIHQIANDVRPTQVITPAQSRSRSSSANSGVLQSMGVTGTSGSPSSFQPEAYGAYRDKNIENGTWTTKGT